MGGGAGQGDRADTATAGQVVGQRPHRRVGVPQNGTKREWVSQVGLSSARVGAGREAPNSNQISNEH